MRQHVAQIRVEIDPAIDVELRRWSQIEGRGKRRQASVLLQKVVRLRQKGRDGLAKLGPDSILRELELA